MNRRLVGLCLTLCIGWMPQNCWALCLGCSCHFNTATGISFGNYNPYNNDPIETNGTIQVHCTGLLGLLASIEIALSTGSSGNYLSRTMQSGANTLNYNLYTNAGRTTTWGDGNGGSSIVTDTFTLAIGGFTTTDTVYARLPERQNVAAGTYSDTITVTVNY